MSMKLKPNYDGEPSKKHQPKNTILECYPMGPATSKGVDH